MKNKSSSLLTSAMVVFAVVAMTACGSSKFTSSGLKSSSNGGAEQSASEASKQSTAAQQGTQNSDSQGSDEVGMRKSTEALAKPSAKCAGLGLAAGDSSKEVIKPGLGAATAVATGKETGTSAEVTHARDGDGTKGSSAEACAVSKS